MTHALNVLYYNGSFASSLHVFEIELTDKSKREYRAGDEVSRYVLIQPKKDISCKKITLQFSLFEYTLQVEEKHVDKEVLHWQNTIRLFGRGAKSTSADDKEERKLIAEKRYAFPFRFVLPEKVISTVSVFNDSGSSVLSIPYHGMIQCALRAQIHSSFWAENPAVNRFLQVRENLDTASMTAPKTDEVDTKIAGILGFFSKEAFHLESKVAKSGFRPGEAIRTSCKVSVAGAFKEVPIPTTVKVSLIRQGALKEILGKPVHVYQQIASQIFAFPEEGGDFSTSTDTRGSWEKETSLAIPADASYTVDSKLVSSEYKIVWELLQKEEKVGAAAGRFSEHRSEMTVIVGESFASKPAAASVAPSVPEYPEEAGEASAPELEHDYWPESIPPAASGEEDR